MGKYLTQTVGLVKIERRGSTWHVRYQIPQGRVRRSLKVTNLRVAERKAREVSDLLERGDYATLDLRESARKLTFSDFTTEFRSNYANWGPTTWQGNESRLKILEAEFGKLALTGITTRHIETYLARRRDQDDITPATGNRYLATLKTMFKMAVRWGYLVHNPAEPVKMRREQSRVPEGLHDDELSRLLAEMKGFPRILTVFAVDTGMRRSEILRLEWGDVDFQRCCIIVRETKNDSFRILPMSDRILEMLNDLRKQTGKVRQLRVFDSRDIRTALISAGQRANLGHVHFHRLRHTFATRLLDKGVPLNDVQYLMGHKTPIMTQRYDHVRPERHRKAIEALDAQ